MQDVRLVSTWPGETLDGSPDIPAQYVTVVESTRQEVESLAAEEGGMPAWAQHPATLMKPATGKRCELRLCFSGNHEFLACEVVSSARIVELYGSAEEDGDVYWQSCRSKEHVQGTPGVWHCPAALALEGERRVTGSPLLLKLFSISAPTAQCRLYGIRVHISPKGHAAARAAAPAAPPQPSMHEMFALAAKFFGAGQPGPSHHLPPAGMALPQQLLGVMQGMQQQAAAAAPLSRSGPPTPLSAPQADPVTPAPLSAAVGVGGVQQQQQQQADVASLIRCAVAECAESARQQSEARVSVLEARVEAMEKAVLPQMQLLVQQVAALRADVEVLKRGGGVGAAAQHHRAVSPRGRRVGVAGGGVPRTPSPEVTASSETLLQARDARKRQRLSLNAPDTSDPPQYSLRKRASSVPPLPDTEDLYKAKQFFGFSSNKEFHSWIGRAARQSPPPSDQTSPRSPAASGQGGLPAMEGEFDDANGIGCDDVLRDSLDETTPQIFKRASSPHG